MRTGKGEAEADRLIDLAFKRLRRSGREPWQMPDPERTIVIVTSAQGVIGNGGFQYFFEMNWPKLPEYRVFSDAYRQIGARQGANRIDRAVAMFPFASPQRSARKRDRFMGTLPESHRFFRLGEAVCLDRSIMDKLKQYVVTHRAELKKPLSRRRRPGEGVGRGGRTSA